MDKNYLDRIHYTNRGFSYVEVRPAEIILWGGMCICNSCGKQRFDENMYLSYVLADTYCKDCWENILKRQEKMSQEDVDYDLKIQNENSLDWYRYHLDKEYRFSLLYPNE